MALFLVAGWRGQWETCQQPPMALTNNVFCGIKTQRNEIFSICNACFSGRLNGTCAYFSEKYFIKIIKNNELKKGHMCLCEI
tara:strand:+ start:146 stop:391 length:246 start_codon:yes stop_codon:yes gene_type:complete